MDVRAAIVAWPEGAPRGLVTKFCLENGVSRSWFYELRARARDSDALTAMQPRVRRSGRSAQAVPAHLEDLAVRIRKELTDQGWDAGPVTVRHKMIELGVDAPATSTLARIFTRRGMVTPQPQKRPHSSYRRFQADLVHQLWQLDAFEWLLADATKSVVFQVLDDRSRQLLASRAAAGETSEDAIAVCELAISRFQTPQRFLTDNGAALNPSRRGFRGQLVDYLKALGCRPITGRPGHPQTQGKDERVHSTTLRWLRAHPLAQTLDELQAQLDDFDAYYNTRRPHQALQMRTPSQAFADGPIAIPPQPPDCPTPSTQRRPGPRLATNMVNAAGHVSAAGHAIQIGHEHIGTRVNVLVSGSVVAIFDAEGRHIRSVTLQPGQHYYGNGRPRGRPKGSKRPH